MAFCSNTGDTVEDFNQLVNHYSQTYEMYYHGSCLLKSPEWYRYIYISKTQLPYPKSRPVHSTLGQISKSSDCITGAHPSETTQHYTGASTMVQATPSNDTLTQTALERLNVQIFPPVCLVRLHAFFVSIIMPQKYFKLQF